MVLRSLFIVATRGSQNFLGFRWIGRFLHRQPPDSQRKLALNILDLSPHYFYRTAENRGLQRTEYLESEFRRNSVSRQKIVDQLVVPYLGGAQTVLDYGCGPGFLARAAAPYAARVYACDLSEGATACARIINPAPNVKYRPLERGRIPLDDGSVDLIYTFAVIQHVTDDVLAEILREWRRVLRPGGRVLCHVVLNAQGWQSEAEWRADKTWRGRAKWRFGLHCFSRTPEVFTEMVTGAGFSRPRIHEVSDLAPGLKDDIFHQQLSLFEKAAQENPPGRGIAAL